MYIFFEANICGTKKISNLELLLKLLKRKNTIRTRKNSFEFPVSIKKPKKVKAICFKNSKTR